MTRLPLPAIVILGVFLLLPTAALGFYADDHGHQLVLRNDEQHFPMSRWALYDFGERADWLANDGQVGTFPWWADDDWRIRFFRPLTSAYLVAQHAVFGEWSLGYHLVGLGLHAFLLVLVHGLYRTLEFSQRGATLGTLLFALCDSATLPVGWPANHNTLLAALFSVAALRLFVDRESGGARLALGLVCALAAAASKEAGSVTLALSAFVLLRRPSTQARALGAVAVVLCVAYAWVLIGGGYGTRSLFYATPWEDPGRYGSNLLLMLTAGPTSLLGPFPLDLAGILPQTRVLLLFVGILVGVPLWIWIGRGIERSSAAGLLALWTLGFLVVQGASLPSDRLLFLPAVGAAGLLALFFDASTWPLSRGRRALLLSATVGSGLFLFVQSAGLTLGSAFLREQVPLTEVGPPALGHRTLYVLQAESQMQGFALHSMWGLQSDDHDLTFWNLQTGRRALDWTRMDATTFELTSRDEPFLTGPFERVYLTHLPVAAEGDTWSTPDFTVEALEVQGGFPTRLRFRMQESLDLETVRFLRAAGGRLVHVQPPAIGETLLLEAPERAGPYMP